jgi:hypothetical protein
MHARDQTPLARPAAIGAPPLSKRPAAGPNLRDDRQPGAQVLQAQLRNVHAVDLDDPAGWLDDAEERQG